MMKVLKSKKGFTLIELLIVMAIIAILIGISLPRFRGMQDEGQKTKAKANLATLRTAVESYGTSPRSNGRMKYPDGDATGTGPQAQWNGGGRAAGTWQTTRLLVQSPTVLLGTTGPIMLSAELQDPFAQGANVVYGYFVNAQGYYVIWSNGTGRTTVAQPTVSATGAVAIVPVTATTLFVSNGNPQTNF